MLNRLLTEQSHPESTRIGELGTAEMLGVISGADAGIAAAVALEIPRIAAAVDAIAARLGRGGHLTYIGAGTSGRLGVLDAAECPPTFQVPPEMVRGIIAGGEKALSRATEASEDDPEAGARDLLASGFGPGDALVGIAASGRTPCTGGDRGGAEDGGADGGDQLHAGFGVIEGRGVSDGAEAGAGDFDGFDPNAGGDGHQDGS